MQTHCEIQRCLPTKLHNHAGGLFDIDDVHHVFKRERLEVQPIRSIIIGRNCFRITVDHDRFVTCFVQGERCVATAVVEFDSLADAIRPGAQNHDLLSIRRLSLVFFFVSRIEVWGI